MGKKLKNIAVLTTALDTDGQGRILRGIEERGRRSGCNIVTFSWFTGLFEKDKHNLGELNIASLPNLNLFDGVIIMSNVLHIESNRRRIEELVEMLTCPVVCMGCKLGDSYSVWTDNYAAMRKLTEHLVDYHRMREFHFVKGVKGNPDAEARFRAFSDVLRERGIELPDDRISQGDFYVTGAEEAAQDILNSTLPFPEAIVCANDTMAITMCDILQKKGYHIPEDVVVTGYDYVTEGQQHVPSLTTIRSRFDVQGKEAVRMLLKLMEGEEVEKDVYLEDEVVLGESCGHQVFQTGIDAQSMTRGHDVMNRALIHQLIEVDKSIMEGDRYEDWLNAVKEFVAKVDPKEFYYCVNENFEKDTFERGLVEQESMTTTQRLAFAEMVKVPIAYCNGRFIHKGAFQSKCAFDELFEESMYARSYVFSPVHFLERNFGYFVFVDSEFPICNPMYISWLIRMGDAIENIRKQRLLQNAMERLDEMYVRDSLTGAYNRFGMERLFETTKRSCKEDGQKMFIGFIDLDGLKSINDVNGHYAGDTIIKAAANVLAACDDAFGVVRYGGDEFVVIGAMNSEEEAERYWRRVEAAVEAYNALTENRAKLAFSYGHKLFEVTDDTVYEDYIGMADDQMYSRKQEKKAERRN